MRSVLVRVSASKRVKLPTGKKDMLLFCLFPNVVLFFLQISIRNVLKNDVPSCMPKILKEKFFLVFLRNRGLLPVKLKNNKES